LHVPQSSERFIGARRNIDRTLMNSVAGRQPHPARTCALMAVCPRRPGIRERAANPALKRIPGKPRPGKFDLPAPPVMSARSLERGDIGQQVHSTGMASRTADGNHSGVARPYRHWATGDCTRFKKPFRLSLRQSSSAPRLPAITASKLRFIVPSRSRSSCALLGRCNEVRLLSRRIIIRLFDDVKKKCKKTCAQHESIYSARTSR
jgi:hypothetical protein